MSASSQTDGRAPAAKRVKLADNLDPNEPLKNYTKIEKKLALRLKEAIKIKAWTAVLQALVPMTENLDELRDKPWLSVQPRKVRQNLDQLLGQLKELPAKYRTYESYENMKQVWDADLHRYEPAIRDMLLVVWRREKWLWKNSSNSVSIAKRARMFIRCRQRSLARHCSTGHWVAALTEQHTLCSFTSHKCEATPFGGLDDALYTMICRVSCSCGIHHTEERSVCSSRRTRWPLSNSRV